MEEQLIKLGFSRNEAKIYLELLKNKDMQAGEISKKTGINRRTTYDSIQRLIEKGYTGFNVSSNRKIFFAMNPKVITDNLKEMEREAKEIMPQLKNLSEQRQEENIVVLYKGRKGIRNILKLILESKGYVSFGSNDQFPKMMQHDFDIFQNTKKKLKIKTKTILGEDAKGIESLKIAIPSTEFKFIHKKLAGPTSTFIFNNKVAIIIWEEPLFAVLIESKKIYESYLEYFEELWKISKK